MDQLAAIILQGSKVADMRLSKNLINRAEENRVPLLYLRMISRFHSDSYISSQLEMWERRKREYDLGFQKLLRQLIRRDIQFILVKHALYPRASYDADLLFRNSEEFEKAYPILRAIVKLIRPDPHVGGVRDTRGCTIVIPTEDLWSRKKKTTYHNIEVYIPSNEDQIILFHLHMLKHREIFLGDLVSTLNLYNAKHDPILLFRSANRYSLLPIFQFVSSLFHYFKLGNPEIGVNMPVISQFIEFLAHRKSRGFFPIKLPKFILGLSVMHFRLREEIAYPWFPNRS